jgi:hypothetical protein
MLPQLGKRKLWVIAASLACGVTQLLFVGNYNALGTDVLTTT